MAARRPAYARETDITHAIGLFAQKSIIYLLRSTSVKDGGVGQRNAQALRDSL